jgi:DNA invertase Pin-like site-specific DNA recombinase
VETGKTADRPQLEAAFAACRLYGAKLVIAKLDRLSRDAHFLLGLEKAGIDFVAADMPIANRLTVGIMALVVEQEGRMISQRTKEALAAAKKRGIKLGGQRQKNGKPLVITKKASALGRQLGLRKAATILLPNCMVQKKTGRCLAAPSCLFFPYFGWVWH